MNGTFFGDGESGCSVTRGREDVKGTHSDQKSVVGRSKSRLRLKDFVKDGGGCNNG